MGVAELSWLRQLHTKIGEAIASKKSTTGWGFERGLVAVGSQAWTTAATLEANDAHTRRAQVRPVCAAAAGWQAGWGAPEQGCARWLCVSACAHACLPPTSTAASPPIDQPPDA